MRAADPRRRWPWLLAAGIVVLGAVAGMFLLPAVQRRVVLGAFPAGPGTSLEFRSLHAGLRGAELRGLRLDWHGLKVGVDEADIRYSLLRLVLARTAHVDSLRVRGLSIDLRSIEPADPGSAKGAGEPFRFDGLRPFVQLPVRAVLSDVDVDAEWLDRTPDGGTVRLHTALSGRDVAPGATGTLDAEIRLRVERGDEARDVLIGTGSLRVHESDAGLLDRLEYHGDGRPASPGAPAGIGLAVRVSADLAAADETYQLAVSTVGDAARDVVSMEATRRAADGHVAGAWEAHVDAGQAQPFLGDFAPPEFALSGTGTFDIDIVARTKATESRFVISASRWDRLHRSLAAVGALRLEAQVAIEVAGPRVEVRSLSARMAPVGGPVVLEVGVDQPFSVDVAAQTYEASRWGAPLAHLRLEGVPVAWAASAGAGVTPLTGTLQGAMELTAADPHRIHLRSTTPIALADVRLRTTKRDIGPIALRTDVDATLTPQAVEAKLAGCRVEFADTSRLRFDGAFAMPRDGRLVATLDGDLAGQVALLSSLVPGVEVVRARGSFELDIPAATLALRKAAVSVEDSGSRNLVEGAVSTIRPLVVDLRDFAPRWTEFEPDVLRLRVDGFPIAWVSRYLPQVRFGSGTLHGSLHATIEADRSVRIAGDAPFEVRGADLFWGDLAVLTGAHLRISSSIVLSRTGVVADLAPVAFQDALGNSFTAGIHVSAAPDRPADAAFTVDLSALVPSLTRRIGNLGAFELHAGGQFDRAAGALRLSSASFECRDPVGRPYLSGTSLQPFSVGLATFAVTPGGAASDLFRATFIPLEIETLFPEALGFTLAGPLPSGEAVISARDGGLSIHVARPLEFGPLTVNRNGAPFLDHVRFSLAPDVAYTATGVRSRETVLDISSERGPIAHIVTRGAFDILGRQPERTFEADVQAALPALFDQPAGRGLPAFDRGSLAVSWSAIGRPSRQTDFRLALSDVARHDGLVAPDLRIEARLEQVGERSFRLAAPLRLGSSGRTSDVTAQGGVRVEGNDVALDLSIDSDRIVLEDVVMLAAAFLPPGPAGTTADAPAQPVAARAQTLMTRFGPGSGRPFWDRLRGTVPIHLGSIEFDGYAVRDARATIVSTPGKLAIDAIRATFLGADIGGRAAVTFDGSSEPPLYGVEATAGVADVELGRVFTTVDPSRPPTLEGHFRLDAALHGSGPDPMEALLESHGAIDLEGGDAVYRGLAPGAKTASRLVRVAGALTFSRPLRATGRLIGQLAELRVREAHVHLDRDPARGLLLDTLAVRSDGLVVHGAGTLLRERGVPLVERPVRLDMDLGAAGDAAIVFDGLGLLGGPAGADGFRAVTTPITVVGTLANPDPSALWTTLDEAAARARGSFGWALRRAMKSAGQEAPPP